ncbi:hypothetical protein OSB04_024120 [Centaurea solstitialis]|uniref:CCHC-type domain-containing protein n=1 Tax=Centaurea solstitialis TaxID=347529 RepID=A0AA38ST16_9ASTR|nr:hypothetical protein OSB04_024120 [Centaurea solstitialis]
MASTVTNTNNLSLCSILEKDKLTGPNFLDWERNLMIVLRHERKWYVLEEPLGEAPPANAPAAARNAHKKHLDDLLDVACLMLATMSPDLQVGLINTNAYDMIRQLRDMFQTQARTERYDATKAFNECKMIKGTSVSDHVMKMKRYLDQLERLGHPVPLQLATDTILNPLLEDYKPFVVNYNMNNMEKSIAELHSMLKTAELNMGTKNKTKDVLMVRDGGVKKRHGHTSTSKGKGPVQAVLSAPKVHNKGKGKGKKVKPNKARTKNRCFTCNEVGHWRQNCPKRHEAGNPKLTCLKRPTPPNTGPMDLPSTPGVGTVFPDPIPPTGNATPTVTATPIHTDLSRRPDPDLGAISGRGRGGSSSSSSSSTSASPPPYRPSSPVAPVARPPPVGRPSLVPRPPHMAHAPVLCLRGMTPTERQEVARLARAQGIHEHMIDHHDHMIDSLIDVAVADSQQLTRVVTLLSHTMASLHHLYTVVYLVVALVVLLFGNMPPRREDPELARLVSEQVMASLPNIVSQVAAGFNTNQNNNQGTRERDCMESVLHISKCLERNKVEYAACLLQGRALTWWNTQVQTRGRDATGQITWEDFKKMLKEEFCPRIEIQKLEAELWHHEMKGNDVTTYTTRFHELAKLVPHLVTPEQNRVDRYVWGLSPEIRGNVTAADPKTLQEAVDLANRLTNNAIRSGTFSSDKTKGKRKMEESTKPQFKGRSGKDKRVTRNYAVQTQAAEKEKGTYQKCGKCGNHHAGRYVICLRCGKGGHVGKDCRGKACFECGSFNHYRNACPKVNQRPYANQAQPANQGNRGGLARGRAFMIGAEEAKQNPDVVTGTFLLNNYPATVLFDSGADRSYVSLEFRPKINKKSQNLKEEHIIEYSNGELVKASKVVRKCTLGLSGKEFSIDLIPIKIGSFDIIVGMDWMSNHRATICCAEKIVMLALPDGGVLEVHGEKPRRDIKIVSYMKMRSHLLSTTLLSSSFISLP